MTVCRKQKPCAAIFHHRSFIHFRDRKKELEKKSPEMSRIMIAFSTKLFLTTSKAMLNDYETYFYCVVAVIVRCFRIQSSKKVFSFTLRNSCRQRRRLIFDFHQVVLYGFVGHKFRIDVNSRDVQMN